MSNGPAAYAAQQQQTQAQRFRDMINMFFMSQQMKQRKEQQGWQRKYQMGGRELEKERIGISKRYLGLQEAGAQEPEIPWDIQQTRNLDTLRKEQEIKAEFKTPPKPPTPEKEPPLISPEERAQNVRDRSMVSSLERRINSEVTKLKKITAPDSGASSDQLAMATQQLKNLDRASMIIHAAQNYIQDGRPLGKRTSSSIKKMNVHFKKVISGDLLDSLAREYMSEAPGLSPQPEVSIGQPPPKIGDTATNKSTGEVMIYTKDGWVLK